MRSDGNADLKLDEIRYWREGYSELTKMELYHIAIKSQGEVEVPIWNLKERANSGTHGGRTLGLSEGRDVEAGEEFTLAVFAGQVFEGDGFGVRLVGGQAVSPDEGDKVISRIGL